MASLSYRTPTTPKASQSGVSIVCDTSSLARLARDLRRASPDAWKAYRVSVRAMAQVVLDDARSRAAFSTRIPQSGRIRITSGGNVKVVFGGDLAPDAAAIENKGRGFVRHPVFGDRQDWTDKNSHPAFLAPAFEAHREEVLTAIEEAVIEAVDVAVKGRP